MKNKNKLLLHLVDGQAYKVLEDDKLCKLMQGIQSDGVLEPGIVRPRREVKQS